jgi:hypothetical protein
VLTLLWWLHALVCLVAVAVLIFPDAAVRADIATHAATVARELHRLTGDVLQALPFATRDALRYVGDTLGRVNLGTVGSDAP